jgi:hypothetical protein
VEVAGADLGDVARGFMGAGEGDVTVVQTPRQRDLLMMGDD